MISAWGPHQTQSESLSRGDRGRPISQVAFYWLIAQRPSCYLNPQTTGFWGGEVGSEPCEHSGCANVPLRWKAPSEMFTTNSLSGLRLQRRSVNRCGVDKIDQPQKRVIAHAGGKENPKTNSVKLDCTFWAGLSACVSSEQRSKAARLHSLLSNEFKNTSF